MQIFPAVVYLLCLAASLLCLALLSRSYRRKKTKLLLWSAFCFVGLAFNNLFLFIDVVVLPNTIDLLPLRHLSSLGAVSVLLYGFIWGSD